MIIAHSETDMNIYLNDAPEKCAYCAGSGSIFHGKCSTCGGHGSILVAQPPKKCAYCGGYGSISSNKIAQKPAARRTCRDDKKVTIRS